MGRDSPSQEAGLGDQAAGLAPGGCEPGGGVSKERKVATPAEPVFWNELLFCFFGFCLFLF